MTKQIDINNNKPQKPKSVGRSLGRLFGYFRYTKARMAVVVLTIIVSAVVNVMISWFVKNITDNYISKLIGVVNPDFGGFISMVFVMAAVFVVGIICGFVYKYIMVGISLDTLQRLRSELFSHMQKLPIRFYDQHPHGDLMSRFNNDIDSIREALMDGVPQFLSSFVTIVSVIAAMLAYNVVLALVVVAMFGLMLAAVKILGKRSGQGFVAQQRALGKVNGFAEEMLEGQKVVKIFSREEESKEGFEVFNEELYQAGARANTYANVLMPIVGNLGYMLYVILAIVGGIMLVGGWEGMTAGVLVAFLMLARSFSMPVTQLSQQFNAILRAGTGAARIFEVLDEPQEDYSGEVELVKADFLARTYTENPKGNAYCWKDKNGLLTPLKGDVRFENVYFEYVEGTPILRNICLYANPGQKIAFVGSTGAGKTTITNLLNRFYEIKSGQIMYDGFDIKRIKKDSLRRSIGAVLQDTNLFTGTVRDNIRYGRPEATDKEVMNAAKSANAHGFIERMPKGYDTMLEGNGANLSQGQRQLLSIARLMVADPPVLVLDEATSSIDTRTEKAINKGFENLMAGKTVFVIAHRLSTVKNSNAIIVLEQGGIIERGSHADLLINKGRYHQLYTGAFEMM